jgi:hypothetical protein
MTKSKSIAFYGILRWRGHAGKGTRYMKLYATHIMMLEEDANYVKRLTTSSDFMFDYRDDPTFTNWESKHGGYSSIVGSPPTREKIEAYLAVGEKPAKELVIRSESESVAETITRLIYCGTLLVHPSPVEFPEPPDCYELTSDSHFLTVEPYLRQQINENVLFGCVIACRAWNHEEVIYSLEKYRLSLHLDYFTPLSGHPRYGQMFENASDDYRVHVQSAHAALAAYSIVEELGVDIRSSSKNPRFLHGDWNPVVKADVVARLMNIGVCEDEFMLWSLRGDATPLEEQIQPTLGVESEYCEYAEVRDRELKVYEAIHYASFIRNYFVAHKFREVTKYITPYDVHNVQSLARLLLLCRLGLWRMYKDDVCRQLGF